MIRIKPSHKGLLHQKLGVPAGKPIPEKKIEAAERSKSPALRKEATFAENAKHFNHSGASMKKHDGHKMGHHSGGERGHSKGLHERGHHESQLKDHTSHGVPTSHAAFEKLGHSGGYKAK